MSAATKTTKKYVLQQSNCNVGFTQEKDGQKMVERTVFVVRNKDEMLETENQCSPLKKEEKSEAKKLRSVRLDLSSLKRGVIQRATGSLSSEESSDDETKKRKMNHVTNSADVMELSRKSGQARQNPLLVSSQKSPKQAKVQPLSIARRNARERNRVKLVNEGFATLRGRIPEYIAEAYNEEKGRKSAKKLSKVETLRMAVDYIRHLESLLDLRSSEEDGWAKDVKAEGPPWDTPNSSAEYPSPVDSTKYQSGCVESPGTSFEYQERIFYDYALDLISRKDGLIIDKRFGESESQSVDDFKYYETFNRLRKENSENGEQEDVDNLENLEREPETEKALPKAKDVILKVERTILPPITESFTKGISVFY